MGGMATDETVPNGAPSPLVRAVAEIEDHVRADGWDQPPRLYALAPTLDVVSREPALATQLGFDPETALAESLTPIEQDIDDRTLDDLLSSISWPETVDGCALVVERIVLPPDVESEMPAQSDVAATWAQRHPARSDVRIVIGVLRNGSHTAVIRVKGHEDPGDLIRNAEISPDITDALTATFTPAP